jgi:hypothetical protein
MSESNMHTCEKAPLGQENNAVPCQQCELEKRNTKIMEVFIPKPSPMLPDGSSFFTAEIMSKEEAMKLPVEKRPICFRISSEMYHAVFEAVGAASMCWNPRPSNEVFSSEEASKIAVDLCFKIAHEVEKVKADLEAEKMSRGISEMKSH